MIVYQWEIYGPAQCKYVVYKIMEYVTWLLLSKAAETNAFQCFILSAITHEETLGKGFSSPNFVT